MSRGGLARTGSVQPAPLLRIEVAGFCAIFVGLGLARFGYPPLIPVMVSQGVVTPAVAGELASANFAGYLVGAVAAERLARAMGVRALVWASLLAATLSFLASALPLGVANLFVWRFVAGVAGALMMVVAPPTLLACLPPQARPRAGGRFFAGVGCAMLVSGLLLPALPTASAATLWLVLGGFAAAGTAVVMATFPAADPIADSAAASGETGARLGGAAFWGLVIVYSTIAVGYIPHTVFWVDFLARALGTGLGPGGTAWMVFGVGALVGPQLFGLLAGRVGFGPALRVGVAGLATVLLIPLLSANPLLLGASSLAAGGLALGSISMVAGRSGELVAPAARRRAWGLLTVLFAVTQGGGAWLLARLLAATDSYLPLFAAAIALLLAALVVETALSRRG